MQGGDNYESGGGNHIGSKKETMDRLSRRRPWLRKLKKWDDSTLSMVRKSEVHLKAIHEGAQR